MGSDADVLIVTVTETEGKSVLKNFKEVTQKDSKLVSIGKRTYHDFGKVYGRQVFMVQSEMGAGGLGASLQTVQEGIEALSPWAVIMVGIAFGIDPQKQAIGDILVAKQLINYEPRRIGKKDILRGSKVDVSDKLLNDFRVAQLYWDEAKENKNKAKVRFGLILSGEKLVDDLGFRIQLQKCEPEAIGGEMEGAGLYAACQIAKKDWILVKSICDWADGHKDEGREERQNLAAENSARFLLYMLKRIPLVQKTDSQGPPDVVKGSQRTLILKSVHWEQNYKENGDFEAVMSYQVCNNTPFQITDLIPVRASWFGHNITYSQSANIIGKDKSLFNLNRSIFTLFQHVIENLSGEDQPTTTFLWFPEIRPPLHPGKEIRYALKISTIGTEKEVFSDTGGYAGMGTPGICEKLSCRVNASPGFKIILNNFTNRNAAGNTLQSDLPEPVLSYDKSYITWEVKEPVPDASYLMCIRLEKV